MSFLHFPTVTMSIKLNILLPLLLNITHWTRPDAAHENATFPLFKSHILQVLSYDPDRSSVEHLDQHKSDTFRVWSLRQYNCSKLCKLHLYYRQVTINSHLFVRSLAIPDPNCFVEGARRYEFSGG